MKKISVMDADNKNIEIFNVNYDEMELVNYVNEIKDIKPAIEDETIHVENYEETKLNSTEDLKQYLLSLIQNNAVNLKEINKLIKSNSPIRNVETIIILKNFMNHINFEPELKVGASEASKVARQFMLVDEEVKEEDIETLVVSAAVNNREAFKNIGFYIENEKNKTR